VDVSGPRPHGSNVCSSGILISPDVCGVAVVIGTNSEAVVLDPVVTRPVTATELALRVIHLMNVMKGQLVDLQLALDVLPAMQLAIKELKKGYIAMKKKNLIWPPVWQKLVRP